MTAAIRVRLADLGLELVTPAAAAASYQPWTRSGSLLFISGQLPLRDGQLVATGQLGSNVDLATGQHAAQWCAVNVLSQAEAALGDLSAVARLLKITVFVASASTFTDHHLVANGASDVFTHALGDSGQHSRSAIGVASLPLDAATEVEAILEIA